MEWRNKVKIAWKRKDENVILLITSKILLNLPKYFETLPGTLSTVGFQRGKFIIYKSTFFIKIDNIFLEIFCHFLFL